MIRNFNIDFSLNNSSAEPCYNESFHFRLEAANVDTTNIVLAIHQPDNKGNFCWLINFSIFELTTEILFGFMKFADRILGRLVLGSFMFARGRGMAHW
jgi:hypothetical protein